jgi:hypothetical protein
MDYDWSNYDPLGIAFPSLPHVSIIRLDSAFSKEFSIPMVVLAAGEFSLPLETVDTMSINVDG